MQGPAIAMACRGGSSSVDEWDATALTFAWPLQPSRFLRKQEYPPWAMV